MKVEQIRVHLEALLKNAVTREDRVTVAVAETAQFLRVKADEVAIFSLDRDDTVLHFLCPGGLTKVGFIPLSSNDSLAARTARENRPFINNRFATAQHASFFERIRLDAHGAERPLPIQKILSVPLTRDGKVRGVIQVSRKGIDWTQAGEDFTDRDLSLLSGIAEVLACTL